MSYFVNNEWSKNQYQTLGDYRTRESTTTRSIFNTAIIGLCFTLLIVLLWNVSRYQTPNIHAFYFNPRQPLSHVTSTKFLSFGLDSSLLRDTEDIPVHSAKFTLLAKYLSPAFVRIGGTSADCLFFVKKATDTKPEKIPSPVDGQDISNFTFDSNSFKALYGYTRKAGLRMIFDLNDLIRDQNNFSWNYTNAEEIISYAKHERMDLDWQLGNEPNSFRHVFNVTITAEQLAKDYKQLRYLLNSKGYEKSILVGPEVNHVGDIDHKGEDYATTFLNNTEDSVNFVTWHQYYLNGHIAQLKDFINPATFNYLPMQIKSMKEAINASRKSLPMWISETSTAYGGGAPNLSDRFVAGFLWIDKLGYSASAGVNVVIRQTLLGGNYAMIGPDLTPNPDWWVSVLFKQFVSEKVLKLVTSNNFGYVRLYAHCTPEKALINRVPAVTIYGINVDAVPRGITIHGIFPIPNRSIKIFVYALTSDYLDSREIKLNGEVLKLLPNEELPPFRPIILEPSQVIVLPAYSIVFMVIHGIEVSACIS